MSLVQGHFTYIVIGGGIAGISCIETLSFLSPDSSLLLISSSSLIKVATNIISLSKTICQFDVEEKNADDLTTDIPNLKIIMDKATFINVEAHQIVTEKGLTFSYKKLCICSGGLPKLIEKNNPFVVGIRDTESVLELKQKIANAKRIIIVGNGGIATELVYEVQNMEIIWVIKDDHIAATFVDPGAAEFFQSKLGKEKSNNKTVVKRFRYSDSAVSKSTSIGAALGPDWHAELDIKGMRCKGQSLILEKLCEIKRISMNENDQWPVEVELTNGNIYGCDFIISATGVVPNIPEISSIEKLNTSTEGGIEVDWKMESSLKDIFAAGDVCSTSWPLAQHWFQMRLWTQARQMGMYSAKCMVASLTNEPLLQDFCFELFTHVTKFFGYKVILLGLFNGQKLDGKYDILLRVTKGLEYIKLIMQNGKMQGAVLIGETDLEEMCENLILDQIDVSNLGEELLNPDIDIDDYFD